MKNFITMSRAQARRYSFKDAKEDYIIISINEPFEKPLKFNRNIHLKDVLYLYFEDIRVPTEKHITMTDEDASKIIKFIHNNKAINTIIIHCAAGASRSVSIRCALEEIYNKRSIGIFPSYKPIDSSTVISLRDLLIEGLKDKNTYILNKLCYDKMKSCESMVKEYE